MGNKVKSIIKMKNKISRQYLLCKYTFLKKFNIN